MAQQVIENPRFSARRGSIYTITRIERNAEDTKLHVEVNFRPGWWTCFDSTTYLQDAVTGEKYLPIAIEGNKFGEKTTTPESGTFTFVVTYPALPAGTEMVHWLCVEEPNETNTYDIELKPVAHTENPLLDIAGNWFTHDARTDWVLGVYDSIVVYDNQFWNCKGSRKKGKQLKLELANEQGKRELTFTPKKEDAWSISEKSGEKALLCKQRDKQDGRVLTETKEDKGTFFRSDSATIQGYIKGYDPRLGFSTGIIYLGDDITNKDYPSVVTIEPDGRFHCTMWLQHPVFNSLCFGDYYFRFYLEPGGCQTLYIDYEDVMENSRKRSVNAELVAPLYMGDDAGTSRLNSVADKFFSWDYDLMQEEI